MFSADDYKDGEQDETTYRKEDGRMVIEGKIRPLDQGEGFFGELWENERERE